MGWLSALICGFLVWLAPATLDFLLFPSMTSARNILDALLVVALVLTTIACTVRYFKTADGGYLKQGIEIGVLWFLMAVGIGLAVTALFPAYTPRVSGAPIEFLMNIGVFFLLVPVITISFGYILAKKMFEVE